MPGAPKPPDEEGCGTYFGGPLQLVSFDEGGALHLQDDAVSILRQIPGKLAVVSIAGLYRTGKSFLLNRVLGLQDGFKVGPSVNPCTRGLWIWGQPVQLAPDYHCVLIDAEGLGSAQRSATCDMQILSLCVLLSSCFIYNSVGAIDEQAIDDLHLMLHMAKHIHVKSGRGGHGEVASELSRYFPRLLWVLRDFHLKLVDEHNAAITERDYLENALKPVPGREDKNAVRTVLRDLFCERDCSTIVRPVTDEADLRHIQRMPYESLRPEFRSQVEACVKKVYTSLKPKRIDGTNVSGPLLASLAAEYCQAINGGALPSIQNSWTSVVQHQLRLSLRDAVQLYREQMNEKVMQRLPMDEDEFRSAHKAAKAGAMKLFQSPNLGCEPACQNFKSELANRIKQLKGHAASENSSASLLQCERVAKELFDKHIGCKLGVRNSYQSSKRLVQDWEEVRGAYLQKAKGPAKSKVLQDWLHGRLADGFCKAWEDFRHTMEEKYGALQRRLSEAEDLNVLSSQESMKPGDGVDQARRRWITDKLKLEVRLQDMRREMEDTVRKANLEKAQLADADRARREQMKVLQDRLHVLESGSHNKSVANSGTAEMLQSLQEAVSATMNEVRSTDMTTKELKLKAEHERQIFGLEREFHRRLAAARLMSDELLESTEKSHAKKVGDMQARQDAIAARSGDLEKQLEGALAQIEAFRQEKAHSDRERMMEAQMVRNAESQAALVAAFLKRQLDPGGSDCDLATIAKELSETAEPGAPGTKEDPVVSQTSEAVLSQRSLHSTVGRQDECDSTPRSDVPASGQRLRACQGGA